MLLEAIMDPSAITELIPQWKELCSPLNQLVLEVAYMFLSKTTIYLVPNWLLPLFAQNHGNYSGSLSEETKWLAKQAEGMGVETSPAFTYQNNCR
jgi:electron-transferring-flavoprotein dehydrogenase